MVIFALLVFILGLLFVVFALLFLICVPSRLEEISISLRQMVALMEKKPFDVDPSDDEDVSTFVLSQSVREDFENSTTLR